MEKLSVNFTDPIRLMQNTGESASPDFNWYGKEFNSKFLALNGHDPVRSKSELDKFLSEKFESEWIFKRPILIRNLNRNLDKSIWTPQSFLREFGAERASLINCRNQRVLKKISLEHFWTGFENHESNL